MNLSSRDKKMLVVLAVVAVAAGGWFFFLRGGSGGEEPISAIPTPTTTAPEPTPTGSEAPPADEPDLVFSGRDPFQPLIDTSEPTTTDDTGNPQPTVSPAESPGTGPTGGSSTSIDNHTVVLLDVFTEDGANMAQIEVDGTVYTVAEGEIFAENFQLVAVNGSCADLLYGSQSFTLCESTGK